MSDVLIAIAQFAPGDGDNLPALNGYAEQAAARGARLVVFPEYSSWFRPAFDSDLPEQAEPLDGPFTAALQALAARLDLTVVAGMLEAGEHGAIYNTAVAVDATGVIASYRKQHLYDAFGMRESDHLAAGAIRSPEIFVIDGVRFGMITCYDLRFPESSRIVTDAGADVIVVPAEWVRGPLKEDHWQTLSRARAIENTVYVVTADHTPPVGVGRSAIIDPSGIELAALGSQAGIAVAPISLDEIARVREVNPALALRRYAVVPRG